MKILIVFSFFGLSLITVGGCGGDNQAVAPENVADKLDVQGLQDLSLTQISAADVVPFTHALKRASSISSVVHGGGIGEIDVSFFVVVNHFNIHPNQLSSEGMVHSASGISGRARLSESAGLNNEI